MVTMVTATDVVNPMAVGSVKALLTESKGEVQLPALLQVAKHDSWQATIDAIKPAIVALHVTAARSFQDDQPGSSGGTGFVVDAEAGLLLTNRHVCTCGPARLTATFVGGPAMEEVPVDVAYLDPVHDFALLRFVPSQIKHTRKAQIELCPAGCQVGEDIKVVGNDSLEKLQILSGTIARIDRNAPDLSGDYHDENTFFAIAGSGTRGGSSGSPVLNQKGQAIALNAAAVSDTMHGFYLPLHRVVRALEALQAGQRVDRGTICTSLLYTSFPECLRLGVSEAHIQEHVTGQGISSSGTFSEATPPSGLLQVRRCLKGSAADKVLKPGDILLKIAGVSCTDFVLLDEVLDRSVGQMVQLNVCRCGISIEVELMVQDLHALIPRAFLELGLGVFHDVSYHTAQKQNIPMRGVYVAQSGFVFGEVVKSDAVILEINGIACENLQRFEELLQQIPDKEYFTVGWMLPKNAKERTKVESVVKMQRHWCMFRSWTLDPSTRIWHPRPLGSCAVQEDTTPSAEAGEEEQPQGPPSKKLRKSASGVMAALDRSLCSVSFKTVQNFNVDLVASMPTLENDVYTSGGAGIVIDAARGFILTDRTTVPQALGDIEVTLGKTSRSASVWFMHPIHNLVVLKVESPGKPFGLNATFVDDEVEVGEEVDFVGVDEAGARLFSKITVQSQRLVQFPRHWPPRWHQTNVEAIFPAEEPPNASSGVLCNGAGHIHALYVLAPSQGEAGIEHSGYALPSRVVMPILRHIESAGGTEVLPRVPSLELELRNIELAKLRRLPAKLRAPAEWLKKLSNAGGCTDGETALQVSGVANDGPCQGLVSEGDLLVAVAGVPVTTAFAVETTLREALGQHQSCGQAHDDSPQVKLTFLRRGKVREVTIPVKLLGSDCATRFVCWNGLLLQETPRSVRERSQVLSSVFACEMLLGSPSEAAQLEGELLISVDGTPTPSLDAILALESPSAVAECRAGSTRRHVRVETADMTGRRFMKALEPDPVFWPTTEISCNQRGVWSCAEARNSLDCEQLVRP